MNPEFTKEEIDAIRRQLARDAGKDVELHLAYSDVLLHPTDSARTPRATVSWHYHEANFVVIKIGPGQFRTRFFYTPHDQYDTGIREYSDLKKCVTAVVQAQAQHARERLESDTPQITS